MDIVERPGGAKGGSYCGKKAHFITGAQITCLLHAGWKEKERQTFWLLVFMERHTRLYSAVFFLCLGLLVCLV
jgi:hypothetical protein